ncbi:MAG TPA: AMP-binding protein, partial [Acidimicrobiia bacterium]
MPGFWKYAEADPNYLAVVDPDGTEHSAGDILAGCNQLLHALRALGMTKGDTVAAVLPNGSLPLTVLLAAQQGGFYYVPINYRLAPPEIAYILKDSEAKVLLSHERFAATIVPAADEAGIPNSHRLARGTIDGFGSLDDAIAAQPTTRPDDLSAGQAMHYTSGTTGFPKGVKRPLAPIDPDMMAELMTGFFGLFGIPQADDNVHLSTSPNYHTAVTQFAGNSIHAKHTVVCMDKWDPTETLRLIDRYKVTHTHMVPTQFHRMLQLPDDVRARYDVSSMKWAIHAAAPCPVDTKRKMLDWWGPVIWEYYAATEGGGTTATPEDWLKYPGTVGKAWAIAQLKVTDDDGNVLAPGEPGTVWMKMGSGDFEYKGDKAKTNKSHDAEGYFTVGDMGYFNEDGFLFLCDRKADMII